MVTMFMYGSGSAFVLDQNYEIDQKSTVLYQMAIAYHRAIRKIESKSTTRNPVPIGISEKFPFGKLKKSVIVKKDRQREDQHMIGKIHRNTHTACKIDPKPTTIN